jgi:hypothetical protein
MGDRHSDSIYDEDALLSGVVHALLDDISNTGKYDVIGSVVECDGFGGATVLSVCPTFICVRFDIILLLVGISNMG